MPDNPTRTGLEIKVVPPCAFMYGAAEITDGNVLPHRDRIRAALRAALRDQGIKPAGPDTFVYHLRDPLRPGAFPERYTLEIGVAVSDSAEPPGGAIGLKTLPGLKCACLTHHGPISAIGETYHALHRELAAHGLRATGRQERDVYHAERIAELQTEVE
jgi:effector-binding domain-containing protein